MTTALDIITSALKRINSYAPGEPLAAVDAQDALDTLNDLLETWSNEHLTVYNNNEYVLPFVAGQYQYTVGNYVGGTFTGTLASGSPTISGVTVPSGVVPSATASLASDVTAAAGVPAGTTIIAVNSGAGTVTMSANASVTVATPQQFTYTIPGNFKIPRPLRITNAFTRITTGGTGLDYPMEEISNDEYTAIGFKSVAGPWPTCFYLNADFPLASLYFFPNPSQAGSLHLWCDDIFSSFATTNTAVSLPQGYVRALKWNLALELAPEYNRPITPALSMAAKESKAALKALNAVPTPQAAFDTPRGRFNDAGWIMHGGFTTSGR